MSRKQAVLLCQEDGAVSPFWIVVILILCMIGQVIFNYTGVMLTVFRVKQASDYSLKGAIKATATIDDQGKIKLNEGALAAKYRELLADNLNLDRGTLLGKTPANVIRQAEIKEIFVHRSVGKPFKNKHGSLIRFPSTYVEVEFRIGFYLGGSWGGDTGITSVTVPVRSTVEVHIRHKP
jgi:hypothetical protein